ncbi:methionyl-tRNA formyltransferase [Glycomyces sp. TRM65418]|uniref:methionyl-tRNA formyltransferase n=1 Tax=Glycomyces sp. TRM65418 TaxID=2867006 RepID=UPI001CE5EFDA|nr:methionyl-tRNA formyltransferase [Glycomyces sp. TRM65418]MCC3764416.1 methionyl-tRNA formyltransferase [Glycomyces sp. TRM65418]QZD54092.1 methionyl-tRNA formyltransferase [Glycomyces sp. TRM65418]
MRIVFAGTPEVALPTLEALHGSDHEVVAVLTRPDARTGRGRKLSRSPVAAWADEHGIETLTPAKPREPEFLERLRDLDADIVPVVAYGALVPPAALEIPRLGWINLHFSLLPAWRGAAPVQHAVLAGDEMTGACVFQLEEGLDTGPVYGRLTEPIEPHDTAGSLLERLAVAGARLTVDVVNALGEGLVVGEPQPDDGVSYAPKITVDDARVRWTDPAFAVDRRIRAVTPAPGAWTDYDGQRLRLGPVRVDPEGPSLAPGEVAVAKKAVHVGTATDPVRLDRVQPAGKKPMDAAAWGRGLPTEAPVFA